MGEVISIFDRKPVETYLENSRTVDIRSPDQPNWFVTPHLIESWVGELVDIIELDHFGYELEGPNLKIFEAEISEVLARHFIKT